MHRYEITYRPMYDARCDILFIEIVVDLRIHSWVLTALSSHICRRNQLLVNGRLKITLRSSVLMSYCTVV